MNKRKILVMAMALCMVAILAIGGSLAYFTDTEGQKNVMTMGKVDISQDEQQFNDKTGALEDFKQEKPLMPMVDKRGENDPFMKEDGYFNDKVQNVVDKIVTVKNEAADKAINQDAYVRTILAFETARHYAEGSSTEFTDMHHTYIGVNGDFDYVKDANGNDRYITVDNVEYILGVKVYPVALKPQETTDPSLKQIFLAPTANNEAYDIFGEEYTILALSQATQTAGFTGAEDALNTAFGNLSTMAEADIAAWFVGLAAE